MSSSTKVFSSPVPLETTLHVRDNCLCLHIQRAARSIARTFDEALRPLKLTHGQFSLLMSLNRPHGPTISSVSELLAMDRTTLTANLKPLERRGLVKIAVDPEDRRSRRLSLTSSGKHLLAKAVPIWKKTHAEFEEQLSDADFLRDELNVLSRVPRRDGSTNSRPSRIT